MVLAITLVGAYLLGSFPTAGFVGRRRGRDPSAEGSRNPGASNVYRLMGRKAGALVLVGDTAKGVAAAAVGYAAADRAGLFACGAAAVVGHCFPVGRWRRGGKGMATAAGVGVVAFPPVAAIASAAWAVIAASTHKASLASIVATVAVPVSAAALGHPGAEVAASAAIGAVVIARHRANVERLLKGEERSLQ